MFILRGKSKYLLAGAAILFVVLAAAIIINIVGAPTKTFATDDTKEQARRALNVNGTKIVYAVPDIAYITMGVITESSVAQDAQKQNANTMDKIVSTIKSSGVKNEDIKTVNYSIYPKYDYNKDTGESKIIGYTVNNSMQVTIRDISKVGNIIDLASENGINTTGNISFGLNDYDSYYNQALKAAVESAKKKAETIAQTMGITLKLPLTITENAGYNPPIYTITDGVKGGGGVTPIQGGSLQVSASISISFEY